MVEFLIEFLRESYVIWVYVIIVMAVSKIAFKQDVPFYGVILMICVFRILYDI